MRLRATFRVAALCLFAVSAVGHVAGGAAGAAEAAPQLTLDRSSAAPGEAITLSLSGFRSHSVTVSVCGNLAKRGSADCNMTGSQSEGIDAPGAVTRTHLTVQGPPMACPCVIRAADASQEELAMAPFDVVGHPAGPLVEPAMLRPSVAVDLELRKVPGGFLGSLRSALGGRTSYELALSIRNLTTEALTDVQLGGSVRGGGDAQLLDLDLPRSASVAPGETWRTRTVAAVPSPVLGSYVWEVTASGAGSPVDAESTVRHVPLLLVLLLALLAADLAAISGRRALRRRATAPLPPVEPEDEVRVGPDDGPIIVLDDLIVLDDDLARSARGAAPEPREGERVR